MFYLAFNLTCEIVLKKIKGKSLGNSEIIITFLSIYRIFRADAWAMDAIINGESQVLAGK